MLVELGALLPVGLCILRRFAAFLVFFGVESVWAFRLVWYFMRNMTPLSDLSVDHCASMINMAMDLGVQDPPP